METLLQTYCFETAVTCAEAEEQNPYIRRMALHLGQYLAIFLAETITGLLQKVLTHPAKGLVDETNAALLTQKFWVQAIYTELLCASSRFRAVREKEQQRPPNGLVKVVCVSPLMEQLHKNMAVKKPLMRGLKRWLDLPAGWTPFSFGSLLHGCLLLLMLSARKATCTEKTLGSWALLPLLTNHSLWYPRFKSLVTRSSDGRLTRVVVAPFSKHALMLIGSPLTRRCSLLSFLDFMKEFFMTCSYRRQRWRGTMPPAVG